MNEAESEGKGRDKAKGKAPKRKGRRRKSGKVFSKMTDPQLFTGAHKHRFDPKTGRGKGRWRCMPGR